MPLFDLPLAALRSYTSDVTPPGDLAAFWDATLDEARTFPLDATDAVITASAVTVAESGTIILDGSPDQGRRAISLIPDHHVCVVYSGDVTAILPEALRRLDGTRPLTMISGPSATSDIELERVEGVHGPRRLDVIIVR